LVLLLLKKTELIFFLLGLFKNCALLFNYLFLLGLTVPVYQDIKDRAIAVWVFIYLSLVGGYVHFESQFPQVFLVHVLMNMTVLLMLLFSILLYSKLVLKKNLNQAIGLGDILFFIVFAVSFPTVSFLVLFSLSCLFSLVLFLGTKSKSSNKTVPLAGFQALFLSLVLFINLLFNFVNLYAF